MSEHELWNELGNLYFMSGALEQAISAYHRSIQLDESYGRPYSNLALIYAQQGRAELATNLFRKSLDLLTEGHEKAITWNRLGNLYRQSRDYTSAVAAFQRADELDPDCKDGREEMGQMLYATSDLSILERAQQMKEEGSGPQQAEAVPAPDAWQAESAKLEVAPPDQPEEHAHAAPDGQAGTAADALEAAQDEPAEPAWLTESAELEPEPVEPRRDNREPPGETQSDEAAAPEREPDFVLPARFPLAFTFPAPSSPHGAALSRVQGIRADVDVMERPEPVVAPASVAQPGEGKASDAASLEVGQGADDPEAEYAKLQRMVQINPRNAAAWDSLGSLHKSMGRYDDALLAYQQAVSIEPQRADYHHHLGLVYAIVGRNEDAIMSFQKVLELAPDHSLAHATLGGYYRKMGLDELAQKHIGKAMRNIYDSESEYNRACFEAIRGNVDQAIELLRIALQNKQTYAAWVIHDPDLDFIRDDPRFRKLVAEYTR